MHAQGLIMFFAAKNHMFTGIEILIPKKKYSVPKYRVHKVSVLNFSTCIAHPYVVLWFHILRFKYIANHDHTPILLSHWLPFQHDQQATHAPSTLIMRNSNTVWH